MKTFYQKKMIAILCGALVLSGCTTTNPYTGQQQVNDTTIGAGIGATGGAVVGRGKPGYLLDVT